MAVPHSFDPHLRVFAQARAQLTRLGFSLPSWLQYPYQVHEFPRPAFMFIADFGDIDLEFDTASFPHPLDLPPAQTYIALMDALLKPRAKPMGRPQTTYWRDIIDEDSTSVGSILSPSRCGYYDTPRPGLAIGYHAAEIAFLIYRQAAGAAELIMDGDNFAVELDSDLFGVMGGQIFVPCRPPIALDHAFNPGLLLEQRYAPDALVPRNLPMWRAIGAFAEERGLADADPSLMQALAHCRYALPQTLDWFDTPFVLGGTPAGTRRRAPLARTADRLLALEGAYSLLRSHPSIPIAEIRRRMVPAVMSKDEWRERIAPLTRFKQKRRTEIIEYLKQMYEEMLASA